MLSRFEKISGRKYRLCEVHAHTVFPFLHALLDRLCWHHPIKLLSMYHKELARSYLLQPIQSTICYILYLLLETPNFAKLKISVKLLNFPSLMSVSFMSFDLRLRVSIEGFLDVFDPNTSGTPSGIFSARPEVHNILPLF